MVVTLESEYKYAVGSFCHTFRCHCHIADERKWCTWEPAYRKIPASTLWRQRKWRNM